MSLQSIAQTLYNEASNGGVITLNDALLDSGTAWATLVQTALLRQQGNVLLSAHAADIPTNPSGDRFTFPAGLPTVPDDSFLNLLGNAVSVTIVQVGAAYEVQLTIQLTALAAGGSTPWVFSNSFSSLLGWPFDALPLAAPQFVFCYGQEGLPAGTSEGLNFASAFSLTGVLAPIAQLLQVFGYDSPALEPLRGLISQTEYGPSFALGGAIAGVPPLDLTALTVANPTVQAVMAYAETPEDPQNRYQPWGQIVLTTTTELSGQPDPLQVSFILPYSTTASYLTLLIAPQPGSVTTSINSLGQWMAGSTWDSFFVDTPASVLLPYLSTFGLQSYTLTFTLGTFSVMSTGMAVGTLQPWVILEDKLVMTKFSVGWQLIDPFGACYNSLAIQGQLDMFGSGSDQITFTGAILLPDLQLSLALFSKTEMTAAQWLQTIVTGFGGGTIDPYITEALSAFSLKLMLFDMDVPNETMSYTLAGAFTVGDHPVDFNVFLDIALTPSFTYSIEVEFVICSTLIRGVITNDNDAHDTIIACDWHNEANPLDLKAIALALGFDDLGIPPGMDMGLTGIALRYNLTQGVFAIGADSANYGKADLMVFKPTGNEAYAFFGGLLVDKPIDLTNLPLVGNALSVLNTVEIDKLQVLITSTVISPNQVTQLNGMIAGLDAQLGATFPKIPSQGMAATVNIAFEFNVGGFIIPLGTGVGGQSSTNMPANRSAVQGVPSGNTNTPVTSSPGSQSDGTTWFNVQKTVGVITFRRIGVRYQESVLWFVLDAGFSAGGLDIDLIGMGVGSPLTTFDPHFTLAGLGIDFRQPGFEIGGALLKVPPSGDIEWAYAGGAVIKAAGFSISALGSYASVYTDSSHTDTMPSLFVFGQVSGAFGGPPAFFVTGLAGGFGYNSKLRLPAMNEVYQFPLVAGAQNPAAIGGEHATPAEVLAVLMGLNGGKAWISPEIGQYWFAAGLQFTSYMLVSTNALLVIQFGNRLQVALLGLSRARFPMAGPLTYAYIELQVEVIVDPAEGEFALAAVLSPNSYLLDPACKLTGGFAFYTWFPPNSHAGDFVITLGGYHPSFVPPSYYPQVPKVGFSWSLDATVSVTGTAYFAMTPAAIMAGGELRVTYQDGDLKAWFRAWANMLMYWNPFHFDVEIGLSVGASYRLDMGLTTVTMEAELGADLHLYGPETGGSVTVHWWVISFTIDFGASPSENPGPLTWKQYQEQLPPDDDIIKIIPVDGLVPNGTANLNVDAPWVVRPSAFSFSVTAAVPNSSLVLGLDQVLFASGDLVNIRPMQDYAKDGNPDRGKDLIAIHRLIVTRDSVEIDLQDPEQPWGLRPRTQHMATAMWGVGPQRELPKSDNQLVPDQLVGFDLVAPDTRMGFTPGVINVAENLAYERIGEGTLPIQPGQPARGAKAVAGANTIGIIAADIAADPYTAARETLFNELVALGVDPLTNDDMAAYAQVAGGIFVEAPLLVPAD